MRPVFTYSSETCTITTKDENNLRIFEMQLLGKIFVRVIVENIWRLITIWRLIN